MTRTTSGFDDGYLNFETFTNIHTDTESLGEDSEVSFQQAEAFKWRVELLYKDLDTCPKKAYGKIEQGEGSVTINSRSIHTNNICLVEYMSFQVYIVLDGSLERP